MKIRPAGFSPEAVLAEPVVPVVPVVLRA